MSYESMLLESATVNAGLVMEAEVSDESMSLESAIVDEGLLIKAELTN